MKRKRRKSTLSTSCLLITSGQLSCLSDKFVFSETEYNYTTKWVSLWKVNEINKKLKLVFKRLFIPFSPI